MNSIKKIRSIVFNRAIALMAPLFTSATFACVYGPGPGMDMNGISIEGSVSDSVSGSGVNEIVVALLVQDSLGEHVYDTTVTSTDGDYFFYISGDHDDFIVTVKTSDVDGANNGGTYRPASATRSVAASDTSITIDISIEKE